MPKSIIEGKIAKTLRKANRLKATHAKLGKVDEVLNMLWGLLEPLSSPAQATLTEEQRQKKHLLENYVELCTLHKLKFQIDAVLADVTSAIQQLDHDPHLQTHDHIDSLVQRLYAILAIDAEHLEARELFHRLKTTYPQHVQGTTEGGRYLSIAPYQAPDMRISITCQKADLEKHEQLVAKFPLYQIPISKSSAPASQECRMRFSLKDLEDFELFHEELRTKSSYQISINARPIEERHFTDWFHCYTKFRKANTPAYCYGASPFTFNVFGCHKLYTPDIAKQLDQCWFSQGSLDRSSGFFFLTSSRIFQQLEHHLQHCGFCPALSQQKLSIGLNLLPYALNPECDPRWLYWPSHGTPSGVIPTGKAMVIAPPETDLSHVDPSQLIEVGQTPYIDRILKYLDTQAPESLDTQGYRGLSTCIHCGVPYKPNTMICKKCRTDFWKYALQDLEQVLTRLRSRSPLPFPTPTHEPPSAGNVESRSFPSQEHSERDGISFELLWKDPQVQQMLSKNAPPEEAHLEAASDKPLESDQSPLWQSAIDDIDQYRQSLREIAKSRPSQTRLPEPPAPLERLQFHEKIWSLISKKYRERRAIETAFSPPLDGDTSGVDSPEKLTADLRPLPAPLKQLRHTESEETESATSAIPAKEPDTGEATQENSELLNAIKNLKARHRSELSKRGVVRVIYLATMDKDTCPLCAYLDGMVMDPDDPATDIFSPPLYPGCTCRREYVLKTEKPQNWPRVTFKFPPKDLLRYLDKEETNF